MGRWRLLVFSALLHAYVGWRLVPPLASWGDAGVAGAFALGLLLAASAWLIPAGFRARASRDHRLKPLLEWSGYVAMGLFSSFLVLTVLRDVLLLACAAVAWLLPDGLVANLDAIERASALVAALGAIGITTLGLVNARRTARVVHVDVPIAGLPEPLHGFTIAQISDIHVGPTIGERYVRRIVDAVNALDADLVAVTGDLVDGSVPELAPRVAPLGELTSRHGTYFVTGNHEYYSGVHPWLAELRRLRIRVLLNEHVVLDHGEASLVLAGVTDVSAHHFEPGHRSDPDGALAGAPADAAVRVLLAHQPRSAAAAAKAGFQLQLSGHTHGGQFWPWNHFVRLQQPFTAGLYRLHDLWVYVSRGTGYWGPPKRFAAPSEITRLRLVRG